MSRAATGIHLISQVKVESFPPPHSFVVKMKMRDQLGTFYAGFNGM
jgi:hypothetical protein